MNIKAKMPLQVATRLLFSASLCLGLTLKASAYEPTKLFASSNVIPDSYEQCRQKAINIANSVLTRSQTDEGGGIYVVVGAVGDSKATIRCIQMPQGTGVTVTAHTCTTVCPASGCESQSIVQRLKDFMYK